MKFDLVHHVHNWHSHSGARRQCQGLADEEERRAVARGQGTLSCTPLDKLKLTFIN